MSDLSYDFGGIEGAPASRAEIDEILNQASKDASDLEETTLVPLSEAKEEMTSLGDASDLDPSELGDGGIEHVDDWETPIV
jgi:hypothetical protein